MLQLRKAHWQLLKPIWRVVSSVFKTTASPVGIEVERLEGLEAAKVLWQLCQAVLAQVQLGDVGEEGEVGRQTDMKFFFAFVIQFALDSVLPGQEIV